MEHASSADKKVETKAEEKGLTMLRSFAWPVYNARCKKMMGFFEFDVHGH